MWYDLWQEFSPSLLDTLDPSGEEKLLKEALAACEISCALNLANMQSSRVRIQRLQKDSVLRAQNTNRL